MQKINSVILSGGKSSRMGFDKALVDYNGKILIEHIIEKLEIFSDKIYIVLGHHFDLIKNSIKPNEKIKFLFNENYELGMFSSIKKAIENIDFNIPFFLQMVDQPFVSNDVYKSIINSYDNNYLLIQPSKNNKKGHPLLFNPDIIEVIKKASLEDNLKNILSNHLTEIKYVEIDDESIFDNINTKELFEQHKNKNSY